MRSVVLAIALAAGPALADGIEITVEGEGANGTIVIDLFEDVAPMHAAQITALAEAGAYDNVVFHRVIDRFMAQTGDVQFGDLTDPDFDMRRAGTGGSDLGEVPAEFSDLAFTRGVVGMARAGDPRCAGDPACTERQQFLDSANSQFFIMFGDGAFLNGKYTIVGEVTSGMDVVDAIKRGDGPNGAVIGRPDTMVSVRPIDLE